jgi:YHS domain-containing protein
VGRSDKIFCSVHCKSEYHHKLRKLTAIEVREINKILARNRSILLELMGKNSVQKKINRLEVDRKKFNYKYHTHFHINSKGKTYFYVYDFAWMEFSDNEILIVRKIAKPK